MMARPDDLSRVRCVARNGPVFTIPAIVLVSGVPGKMAFDHRAAVILIWWFHNLSFRVLDYTPSVRETVSMPITVERAPTFHAGTSTS